MGLIYKQINLDEYFTLQREVSNDVYHQIDNLCNIYIQYITDKRINTIFSTHPLSQPTLIPILEELFRVGISVWIDLNGEICYRFGYGSEIQRTTPAKANIVFSSAIQKNVSIAKMHKSKKKKESKESKEKAGSLYEMLHTPVDFLPISYLVLVEREVFKPSEKREFYIDDVDFRLVRNTFKPSYSLWNNGTPTKVNDQNQSIILKYIYYLANEDANRFQYILSWIASFFNDLSNRSNVPLVLHGEKNSGIEILFEHIIRPLFGHWNCVTLDDDTLAIKKLDQVIENKLFYHLDNISTVSTENKKTKILLKNLSAKARILNIDTTISADGKEIFGQILITGNTPFLHYMDGNSNYLFYKVRDNIERDFKNDMNYQARENRGIKKATLIKEIKEDLNHFVYLLRRYTGIIFPSESIDINDDRESILLELEDKLKIFSEAIMAKDEKYFSIFREKDSILYHDIVNDFDKDRIKQKNLIKCFNALYEEEVITSPRTLMVKLRNTDDFFKNELHTKSGGIKYFYI